MEKKENGSGKKMMILGASALQVPAIKKAKELGIPILSETDFLKLLEELGQEKNQDNHSDDTENNSREEDQDR